ncbi:hypothetical protein CC2G_003904 [Coprinopsis cinerea AmutBmut pab1-1]|nr:hypothetical protein CC2G_003904 [Coprinopsis cinerea AmutBmut pab1-1]
MSKHKVGEDWVRRKHVPVRIVSFVFCLMLGAQVPRGRRCSNDVQGDPGKADQRVQPLWPTLAGAVGAPQRSTYPPYGFYILNRAGSQDYISRLYPEDYLSAQGQILAIRHFAQFTNDRLANLKASLGGEPMPGPFDERYIVPDVESLTHDMKGEHSLMGLWYHSDGNREPLSQVMQRLHSYIKRNEPYPEEFRYGPGHPPPPNRLRAVPRSASSQNTTSAEASQESCSESESSKPAESDVERLFAKLVAAPQQHAPPPESQVTPNTVESLFAKLIVPPPAPAPSCPAPTGLNLLDTIFASAQTQSTIQSPPPQQPKIYSPTPTVSNGTKILNQDVISTLLGLPPSRSASVASTSARSTTTSRDGDNEEESDGNLSPGQFGHGSGESRPASTMGYSGLLGVPDVARNKLGRIKGDVTPRAFAPSAIESVSSIATVRGQPQPADSTLSTTPVTSYVKPRANRELVPFESDSELWPYSASHAADSQSQGSNDDIVELDFEDTSILSNPDALSKVFSKNNGQLNGHPNTYYDDGNHQQRNVNGREKGSKGRRKASRRERDAKERAEIEKTWEMPEYVVNYTAQAAARRQQLASPPASPSPPVSPSQVHPPTSSSGRSSKGQGQVVVEAATPTMSAKPNPMIGMNGNQSGKKQQAGTNGASATKNQYPLDKEVTKNCIITALDGVDNSRTVGKMEKEQFVHQVMALLHSDRAFVDDLYHRYMTRSA